MIAGLNLLACVFLFLYAERWLSGPKDPFLPEQPSLWTPAIRFAANVTALYTAVLLFGTIAIEDFDQLLWGPNRKGEHLIFLAPPMGVLMMMQTERGQVTRYSPAKKLLVATMFIGYPFGLICYRILTW